MLRECTDLEGAILFLVGFVFGGSHVEDWRRWQTEVLRFADQFTSRDLQDAFENLAAEDLLVLTNHCNQPFRSDQRRHFFAGLFRATLTLEGAQYFHSLRVTTVGGKIHVGAA